MGLLLHDHTSVNLRVFRHSDSVTCVLLYCSSFHGKHSCALYESLNDCQLVQNEITFVIRNHMVLSSKFHP